MADLDEEKKGIDHVTIDLVFPGEDIQLIQIESALQWLRTQIMKSNQPWREQGGIDAYNVLNSIHTRVLEAIGRPEWIYPPLEIEKPAPPPDLSMRIVPRYLMGDWSKNMFNHPPVTYVPDKTKMDALQARLNDESISRWRMDSSDILPESE